jgi:hypothetical protein
LEADLEALNPCDYASMHENSILPVEGRSIAFAGFGKPLA